MRYDIASVVFLAFVGNIFAQQAPPVHVDANMLSEGVIQLSWESGPVDGIVEDFEDGIAQDFKFHTPSYGPYPGRGYYEIENGYAEITSGWHFNWASCIYDGISFHDFTCEVVIQNTAIINGGGASRGMIFRADSPNHATFNGYEFVVAFTPAAFGHYSVGKYVNGSFSFLIYSTYTDAVNTEPNAINVLKVVVQGSTFNFYINDIYIDSATSSLFDSGFVGFTQAEGVTAWYHEISCTYDAQLQDRSVEPEHGETSTLWLDAAGRPMDHPPVMAEPEPYAEPRQRNLRGHQLSELDEFVEYRIYRNGVFIGATPDTVFTDLLPNYGTYEYSVTAFYDPEGESIPSVAEIVNWQPVTYAIEGVNTVIPYTGGTISYDALLFNELNQTFPNVTYRAYVKLPDQSIAGPVFQRTFNLNPHMYVHFPNLTQYIPAGAPPGDYTFFGKLFYQGQPVLEQSFEFDKMGGGE